MPEAGTATGRSRSQRKKPCGDKQRSGGLGGGGEGRGEKVRGKEQSKMSEEYCQAGGVDAGNGMVRKLAGAVRGNRVHPTKQ